MCKRSEKESRVRKVEKKVMREVRRKAELEREEEKKEVRFVDPMGLGHGCITFTMLIPKTPEHIPIKTMQCVA